MDVSPATAYVLEVVTSAIPLSCICHHSRSAMLHPTVDLFTGSVQVLSFKFNFMMFALNQTRFM